jgi:hypothetical protein
MKLIGYAFQSGRIDFSREDNPWAFTRIDSEMKSNQRDRILVDPAQAPIELRSAPVNDEEPEWMLHMEQVLQSANVIVLQFRTGGFLRFRKATHDAKQNREFITLGNQEETDLFAEEHWGNVRYLFAHRRNLVRFDVTTMITHREGQGKALGTRRVELISKLDDTYDEHPVVTFDSSGQNASVEIIEWRGEVKEGEMGRYAPDKSHIDLDLTLVNRPFTFLHEDRKEFNNHSYTFMGEKMQGLLARLIKTKIG